MRSDDAKLMRVASYVRSIDRWRSRLGPLLEAWDKLASSIGSLSDSGSGSAGRRGSRRSSRTPESGGKSLQPVDAFVQLETESAAELLAVVSASLGALRKARLCFQQDNAALFLYHEVPDTRPYKYISRMCRTLPSGREDTLKAML